MGCFLFSLWPRAFFVYRRSSFFCQRFLLTHQGEEVEGETDNSSSKWHWTKQKKCGSKNTRYHRPSRNSSAHFYQLFELPNNGRNSANFEAKRWSHIEINFAQVPYLKGTNDSFLSITCSRKNDSSCRTQETSSCETCWQRGTLQKKFFDTSSPLKTSTLMRGEKGRF